MEKCMYGKVHVWKSACMHFYNIHQYIALIQPFGLTMIIITKDFLFLINHNNVFLNVISFRMKWVVNIV